MNSQINLFSPFKVLCIILLQFSCQSKRCNPLSGTENTQIIEFLAYKIIENKNDLSKYSNEFNPDGFRFECGKIELSDNLKKIDSICLAKKIIKFYVNKNDEITFLLEGQSDFFSGHSIERKIFFSSYNKPNVSYEDDQIKNKCYKKIADKIWYLEDEVNN